MGISTQAMLSIRNSKTLTIRCSQNLILINIQQLSNFCHQIWPQTFPVFTCIRNQLHHGHLSACPSRGQTSETWLVTHQRGDWNSRIESEVCPFSVFKMFKFPVNRVHQGSKFMISTNDLRRHLLSGRTCVRPTKNKSECKLSRVS